MTAEDSTPQEQHGAGDQGPEGDAFPGVPDLVPDEGFDGDLGAVATVEVPKTEVYLARAGRFASPLLMLATLLLWMALRFPEKFPQLAIGLVTFIFTPVGKFTATWFVSQGLGVLETIFILGTVDVIIGLFLVWNFGAIHQIPRVGPFLARLESKGEALLQRSPWIRRFAFFGLAAFVAIPIQGSGAIGGAIVGRILGLGTSRIIAAIALGGYTAVAAVTLASAGVGAVLRANTASGMALLVLLLGIALAVAYGLRGNRRRRSLGGGP